MFQRLTSLFFGAPPTPEDSECPGAFVSEDDEVDGWLIIDLQDSYTAPGATAAPVGRPPPAPSLMDESWFVTPPACFTAEGPGLGPARLQSNPLEDLLIEHPSMSVYVTGSTIVVESGPPSPLPDAALRDGDLSDGELAPARREPRALHHAAATGAAPLPARAVLLEKAGQVRRLQRARQRAERHALSAKVVQRQNRARESRPRRPKHQGSFVYQPCQRQFNY
ncbi:tumor protein p53-inducible nuclear protein 2 isoform X1 [Ochotona princeps]|uniref:tumor protein p53-inducible nuclear protein 2 isoform X1 n=1 Tax=Ochotona princeps TaxID=9978 RepID=UPI00032B2882|nr:tumor protein p53-inducible nuclear protein 2 isoform X1 [Ochotona princeps]XP_058535544.1 tumor protein p53-inducible nuclear protein 2 isoform X1 [Ochotona princeps]